MRRQWSVAVDLSRPRRNEPRHESLNSEAILIQRGVLAERVNVSRCGNHSQHLSHSGRCQERLPALPGHFPVTRGVPRLVWAVFVAEGNFWREFGRLADVFTMSGC